MIITRTKPDVPPEPQLRQVVVNQLKICNDPGYGWTRMNKKHEEKV